VASAIRYAAFISYSHQDSLFARWLHRALESYAIPKALIGRETQRGTVPARIGPIFRDRDELSASASLNVAIEAALDASDHLIVLGSPPAAGSRWVDAEILAYKRRYGEKRVIAAILSGEPMSGGADECFPPALRYQLGLDGAMSDLFAEPVAADFRPGKDGKRLALLKIVAALIDVRLDELVQREAQRRQRRQRRLIGVAAASLAGMAVTSGLAIAAVQARHAADRQRAQAEGLVEYMLTDLRGNLERVGRLDALDSVGERALKFYAAQRAGELDSDALGRRSRALHLIGEVATLRGDLARAQRVFTEAAASTAEQLRRHPDDPQRIFDQAQSVFWVGSTAWQRGDLDTAEHAFDRYRQLADDLVQKGGARPDWLAEVEYANSNLGTVLLDRGHFVEARIAFARASAISERLLKGEPSARERIMSMAQSLAWLGDAEAQSGRLGEAREYRAREIALYERLLRGDPRDVGAQRSRAHAQSELARFALLGGAPDEAVMLAERASQGLEAAVAVDPDNASIQSFVINPLLIRTRAELSRGRIEPARAALRQASLHFDRLRSIDASPKAWRDLGADVATVKAQLALADGQAAAALSALGAIAAHAGTGCTPRRIFRIALRADLLEGEARLLGGDAAAARRAWQRAVSRVLRCGGALEPEAAATMKAVTFRLGDTSQPSLRIAAYQTSTP